MQQGQRDQTESNFADNDVELFMRGVIDFDNKKNRISTGFKGRKTQKGKVFGASAYFMRSYTNFRCLC